MDNKKYALISVYDKTDLELAAKILVQRGYEIIATEGTGKYLNKFKIPYIKAGSVTGNPDALKDCIQTISYNLQAGILHDHNLKSHKKQIKDLSIKPIHVVICNFPPIKEIIKSPEDFNIQHIDVGGPLMVRAAATNYKDVIVLVDKSDYERLEKLINNSSGKVLKPTFQALRKTLAMKAFQYTIKYDRSIIDYLVSNKE